MHGCPLDTGKTAVHCQEDDDRADVRVVEREQESSRVLLPVDSARIAARFREKRERDGLALSGETMCREMERTEQTRPSPQLLDKCPSTDALPNGEVASMESVQRRGQNGPALPCDKIHGERSRNLLTRKVDWILLSSLIVSAVSTAMATVLKKNNDITEADAIRMETKPTASAEIAALSTEMSTSADRTVAQSLSRDAVGKEKHAIDVGFQWPSGFAAKDKEEDHPCGISVYGDVTETNEVPVEEATIVLPESVQAAIRRARSCLDPSAEKGIPFKGMGVFGEEDRSYEEAMESVKSDLGTFDYDAHRRQVNLPDFDDMCSFTRYHVTIEDTPNEADWKRHLREEIARRIEKRGEKRNTSAYKKIRSHPLTSPMILKNVTNTVSREAKSDDHFKDRRVTGAGPICGFADDLGGDRRWEKRSDEARSITAISEKEKSLGVIADGSRKRSIDGQSRPREYSTKETETADCLRTKSACTEPECRKRSENAFRPATPTKIRF